MQVIQGQKQFVLQHVVDLVGHAAQSEHVGYSQIVEFAVRELVKEWMRELALEKQNDSKAGLLDRAIEQVEQQVQAQCPSSPLFALLPYSTSLRRGLKYAAREIGELSSRLRELEWQERSQRTRFESSEAGVCYSIVAVGQPGAIEALVAMPEGEEFGLEIDRLGESYEVEGEWFPFQVTVGELQFIVDDDGVIYTCTDNFPKMLHEKARETLSLLTKQIYVSRWLVR
ncbi:MAG TPA: hypothetical protein V6D10_07655 [Trichocoleus sp.]|jgi:uncharacterized protein YbaR (Trm112 family)